MHICDQIYINIYINSLAIVSIVWLFAGVCFFIALPILSWLWLISIFNLIQVSMVVMSSNILLRQDSWVNFSGNVLNKLLLSLINPSKTSKQKEPLIKSVDQSELENV
ncbi:cystinosin homolog isoform X1 [Humulus lupulus]|uniref:cystinosin homolog isoform X1 n=1 Tax=Humulus lupulus TaxID=3486 RepID=UPI002B40B4B2|nr:cystinosin homolog isoform X1 [Humulus lupulus]